MSEISRRDVLRRLALALTAAGTLDRVSAQEVHQMAARSAAAGAAGYSPLAFTDPEFRTLERLTDLIIPVENGEPRGACRRLRRLDRHDLQRKRRAEGDLQEGIRLARWRDEDSAAATDFVSATPSEQTALLDLIAYRRNETPELAPGIDFFTWVRRMTVDAFYTSEIGIKDIDYRGNSPMGSYPSPTEAIAYALKRTGI